VQGPFEDFELAGDVYATSYLIARNATPDMYSIDPFKNKDVRVTWLYLLFIIGSQLLVILAITVVYPPVVGNDAVHVDCANATAVADLHRRGLLSSPQAGEPCQDEGAFAFEADVRGKTVAYYLVEQSTYFYHSILAEGTSLVSLLRLICCSWVFSQVYFEQFERVRALLQYRDFSQWFLPLKGEQVRNQWTLSIPLIQYAVQLVVVTVSFLIICAQNEPFDIVMNSLAFTFISEVGSYFNAPLAKTMASTLISNLGKEYGEIYYLYPEYKVSNAIRDDGTYTDSGWYILEDEEKAGLLNDYKVRHNEGAYPHPSSKLISVMEVSLFVIPVTSVLLGALISHREQLLELLGALITSQSSTGAAEL